MRQPAAGAADRRCAAARPRPGLDPGSPDHAAGHRAAGPGTGPVRRRHQEPDRLVDVSYHALLAACSSSTGAWACCPDQRPTATPPPRLPPATWSRLTAHLGQLAGCSLLEAASPGRYRMHDLLRAHARTLATTDPGSGEEARARLHHYYQHTARRAATLTTLTPRPGPGGPRPLMPPRCQAPPARGPGSAPSAPTCKRPSTTPDATASART